MAAGENKETPSLPWDEVDSRYHPICPPEGRPLCQRHHAAGRSRGPPWDTTCTRSVGIPGSGVIVLLPPTLPYTCRQVSAPGTDRGRLLHRLCMKLRIEYTRERGLSRFFCGDMHFYPSRRISTRRLLSRLPSAREAISPCRASAWSRRENMRGQPVPSPRRMPICRGPDISRAAAAAA